MLHALVSSRSISPYLFLAPPSYPPATPPYSGEDQVRKLKGG